MDNAQRELTQLAHNVRLEHDVYVERGQELDENEAGEQRYGVDDGQMAVQETHRGLVQSLPIEDERREAIENHAEWQDGS